MYLIKVDANGDKVWEKIYKAQYGVHAHSIIRCEDGGFIVTGNIDDLYRDGFYVLKVDSEGEKVWDNVYFPGWAYYITESGDGGYVILGGHDGYFVVKIDSEGNLIWTNRLDIDSPDYAHFRAIVRTDEGFILAGRTSEGMGSKDTLYLVGLDQDGNKTWEKTYTKLRHLEAFDIIADEDGFIVVGEYGQAEQPWGNAYFLKIDVKGNKIWETTIHYCEEARAITEAGNGEFVFVCEGESYNPSPTLPGWKITQDIYVGKIRDTQPSPIPELPFGIMWCLLLLLAIATKRKDAIKRRN